MQFDNFDMSDDQRIDIVEGLIDHVDALHDAFVDAEEYENATCVAAEFFEWLTADEEYEVMWAPNFTLIN